MLLRHTILLSICSLLTLVYALPSAPLPPSLLSKRHRSFQCHTIKHDFNPIRPKVPDCIHAIRLVTQCSEKSHAPMQFSTTTGFTVPHAWRYNTCEVVITAFDPAGHPDDTFTLYHVADRAREVVGVCINSQVFRFGGRTTVGPQNAFWVAVQSTQENPESTPRPMRLHPDQCFWSQSGGGGIFPREVAGGV